ncbi:MAG TPA: M14 family zinc carboxypeptidase [Bryobacteraceae bacterium]|nr:M14 family zinc carboxypeptidase [Bryobacteraceae bacterium]
MTKSLSCMFAGLLVLSSLIAFQPGGTNHLTDPFATGWMVVDTNGDGIADFVAGKIVVPEHPTAAQNAAAADIAARVGFATTGFTPPVVISAAEDRGDGPRIYVGRPSPVELEADEGGVFIENGNLIVAGRDDTGLLAAAEAFAARAPFLWRVPGARLSAIADAAKGQLTGVTYLKGKAGVDRVFVQSSATSAALEVMLNDARFSSVHQIVAGAVSATNPKPLPPMPAVQGAAAGEAPEAEGAAGAARLDLAAIYTMRGLFRGTPRMPIPQNLDGQLYVPAGAAGIAMANLAARMGMETTGITLPFATPADAATVREIRTKSVVPESSNAGQAALEKLREESPSAPAVPDDEGELRVVDKAFGRQATVLVRGDEAAALGLLAGHFPNLWETGKKNLSLEEIRYDLHRFFSLRSSAGQASVALYRLDKWAEEIKSPRDVEAKVFVDVADPGLSAMVRKELQDRLGVSEVKVETASLHAGTQCCEKLPALHYHAPGYVFHPGTPAIEEDIRIPWEGTRLINAIKSALPKINGPVHLLARVSEGPEVRRDLKKQIEGLLPKDSDVTVLSAFKSGVSWLMDEIAPQVKGKAASIKIEFKRDDDPTQTRTMYSHARWVQELYPVDEMLAHELKIPLSKIDFEEFDGRGPTYRVHVFDAAGKEILTREFTVTTVERPYNGVMPEYEKVQVDTGWVRIDEGSKVILDQRIPTDIETFWDRYQKEVLPRVYRTVMARYHGDLRPEFAPPFDTLKMDFHLSEPNYELPYIDKERISSLEALQEDIFYSTENFVNMMGDLESGRAINYVGRIIPIVHASEDGKDGHVHLEFYAKADGAPSVELAWTDAQGTRHRERRDLWTLTGAMQPRLVAARATANGPEGLTWELPADFKDDRHAEWVNEEGEDQVDRSIFSVEQARGQLHWLEQMHAAGMYRDQIAYPHLKEMNFEFELPRPLAEKVELPAPREYASVKIQLAASPRPMITDYQPKPVQWDEPIPPAESASVLAELAQSPGVDAYWMGRSYLGENIWVADVTLPTPSTLRSIAKETTLKATIVYSGRQHANEVSSTSHILKLGEELVNDPATRALLKQVNVVLHPITNPDGAELSVQLAEITPNNMLHPGYHGALAADVSMGQGEIDPVYPESRTRRQLLEGWLPDAFLNPHGYPSHEWVQPFSEYSGWVQTRQGANNGRTWWIPRGWFTSLGYVRDDQHPYSEKIAYELRDRIVEAERNVPGLLDLENRMNARYQRFGQRWQPENMQQPIVHGIRIYMALKGAGGGRGGVAAGSGGVGNISPDVTWDSGYTEAPDETAHGDYMKLMASAGLAFDRVHLEYLAHAKLRIRRTEREQGGRVTWRVERLRPNLPVSENEPANETPTHNR